MTALLALLGKVPVWIWLALIALGVIGWQHIEVTHYKAAAVSAKAETVAVKAANVANLATITKLEQANRDWADKYAADVATATKAAQDAKTYAEAQHRAAQAAQKALNDAYAAHPDAKAWADSVVPSSVVRVLTGSGQD